MIYTLITILVISICLNLYQIYCAKIQDKMKPKVEKDLRLLSDLMSNERAIIEIKRIAPSSMFIRSPKDMM